MKRHHDWVARIKEDGKEIPADRKVPSDVRLDANPENSVWCPEMRSFLLSLQNLKLVAHRQILQVFTDLEDRE